MLNETSLELVIVSSFLTESKNQLNFNTGIDLWKEEG